MSYIHTYHPSEQARLVAQAEILQPWLYDGWEVLPSPRRVLEVGCGVGAQLRFLKERFPEARLTGLDRSSEQLSVASRAVEGVQLVQGQAEEMPLETASFDLVLTYFVLEHLSEPAKVLQEIDRVLRPGGHVILSEVHNSSLFFYPECSQAMAYWRAYNRSQRDLGGDPEVGVKLPYLGRCQGWKLLTYRAFAPCLDGRLESQQSRRRAAGFWADLFRSALSTVQQQGHFQGDFESIAAEILALAERPDGVIDYQARQALFQKGK